MDDDELTHPSRHGRRILAALDADLPALPEIGVNDTEAIDLALELLDGNDESAPRSDP